MLGVGRMPLFIVVPELKIFFLQGIIIGQGNSFLRLTLHCNSTELLDVVKFLYGKCMHGIGILLC